MKNKIFIALSVVGVVILAVVGGYFLGSHKISINSETNNKIFVKNGFRVKVTEPPKNYVYEKQICGTDIVYDMKYFLFRLYEFQQMTPEERIKIFEDKSAMEPLSEEIAFLFEMGKQYKIADNYCIGLKYREHGTVEELVKVNCNENIIEPLESLPYERIYAFSDSDNEGTYYKSYIKKLWLEFKSKGIDSIKREINEEELNSKCYNMW